ncbi:hypothetical protein [Agromyces laixinhei]|uniref:hypothetical protein n=1 Tax=Agromyces laixinhei TaxID=2585717 RepID=UPI0012EEDAE4|nr:hypothetical protein [Agromyces laixinhei]
MHEHSLVRLFRVSLVIVIAFAGIGEDHFTPVRRAPVVLRFVGRARWAWSRARWAWTRVQAVSSKAMSGTSSPVEIDHDRRLDGVDDVIWVEVDDRYWVGNVPGIFVGSIEQSSSGFETRDMFGVERGTFEDLRTAQRLLRFFMGASWHWDASLGSVEREVAVLGHAA